MPPDRGRSFADEYADTLALARVAEAAGFDGVWASEHHAAEDGYLPSVLVLLAGIAAVTERLVLGTAVALAPFQSPLRFAEDCAVLDQLSRGRLRLGLGAGWRREEFAAFGVPFEERVSRTSELAQVCRLAWDRPRFSFAGRHFRFDDVAVTPRPYGHLPLYLGGTAPTALARAARLGDGWIGTPMNRLDDFREQVATFDAAAVAAGREPARLTIGFHVNAWVSADGALPESVRAAMWHQIGMYRAWHERDEGRGPGVMGEPDDDAIRVRTLLGRPDDLVAQLRPWVTEFAGRDFVVIIRLHYPGMRLAEAEGAVRLFGERVIPALRSLAWPGAGEGRG